MNNNKVYLFFADLLLRYFDAFNFKNGDKFQLRFENKENVKAFYDTLRIIHDNGEYEYNDYKTYYFTFGKFKLIIASHENEDFLTGLRNNYHRVHSFDQNTAILFIHSSDLESINKGALDLTAKHMPFHYESIIREVQNKFSEAGTFSRTQCNFITVLLNSEHNDFHVENNNIFDLTKYLNILVEEKLTIENFHELKLFHDTNILNEEIPKAELTKRVQKNQKWYSEMSLHEDVGSLEDYIEKNFGTENKSKLKRKEDWIKYSYNDLCDFEEKKGTIKFNEYLECSAYTSEELVVWDLEDGHTAAKRRNRNIIVFNPGKSDVIKLSLKFRRKVDPKFLQDAHHIQLSELNNSLIFEQHLALGSNASFKEISYRDVKNNKTNKTNFKILILPFDEILIRNFKTNFFIQVGKDYSYLGLTSDTDLEFNSANEVSEFILSEKQTYNLNIEETLRLTLSEIYNLDKADIAFKLNYGGTAALNINLRLSEIKPLQLTGWATWLKKNASKKSILYSKKIKENTSISVVTLEHGNAIYFPTGDFRANLALEENIISNNICIGYLDVNGKIKSNTILDDEAPLITSYLKIIDYFKNSSQDKYLLLPSLAYIDQTLEELYKSFLDTYLVEFSKLKEKESLTLKQQALLKIGTVEKDGNNRLYLTPLHPLMIAYQLNLKNTIDDTFFNEPIDTVVKRLTPINLLPFINNGSEPKNYFIASEQEHSPEWIEYINAALEGQSLSRRNVPEMITNKTSEFVKHFGYLFLNNFSPIRINLVNSGDCREALKGVFDYFSSAVKDKINKGENPNQIHPIHINIYGSNDFVTAFEHFSKFDNDKDIKELFDIDLEKISSNKIDSSDLLNLYHEKIHFSIKESLSYEYCHISFYQFKEEEIEKSNNNVETILTGINLNGVLNDLPSVHTIEKYRTSFGTQHLDYTNQLLDISKTLNSMAYVNNSSTIYTSSDVFSSVINHKIKNTLTSIYDSSQWVTFINPRVDLSFFKDDKDVVIIHYTDQYGNSTGYDSITVTTKWEQYEFIIAEYLNGKVEFLEKNVKQIINMFNAINGYWLLKLGSQTNYVEREKISVLSAFKEALALLDHPNITWVSLSLEEILRVTGGAGLKQNDPNALFSVKSLQKSGSFSDDILMVGIETIDDSISLYFYPIEVKIGKNSTETIEHAIKQSKHTFELLYNTLNKEGFTGKIFRNYLCNLVLNSAQKLALYDVWPEYSIKWLNLNKLRGKLLNDEFVISSLSEFIGESGVISFRKSEGYSKRKLQQIDDSLVIELFESDGLNDLVKSVEDLKKRYNSDQAIGITKNDLLSTKYKFKNPMVLTQIDIGTTDKPILENNTSIEENKMDIISEPTAVTSPIEILFGYQANSNKEISWFPTSTDKVMHTNTGIIGTMGTGKTQFTKSLITQLINSQGQNVDKKPIGILIFDYKGDYIKSDFVKATEAKVYELENLPYNPLALSLGEKPKRRLPVHVASTFIETLSKAFNLGHVQALELKEIVNDAYTEKGIYKDDPSTWTLPAPTLEDVFNLYLSNDKVKKDSLYAAIDKLNDFGIFEPNTQKTIPLFELINGVTIINLNGYSNEIQTLIVAITLDLFYAQMQIHGHSKIDGNFRQITKMILVDEADNFLSKNFESLRKILKEGREYGVGTILSTQFLNHFSTDDNEYSNYILTWIIHRVNEIKDREISSLFDIPNKKDRDDLIGEIKSLEKHYSIINLAGSEPIKIKDLAFWELIK